MLHYITQQPSIYLQCVSISQYIYTHNNVGLIRLWYWFWGYLVIILRYRQPTRTGRMRSACQPWAVCTQLTSTLCSRSMKTQEQHAVSRGNQIPLPTQIQVMQITTATIVFCCHCIIWLITMDLPSASQLTFCHADSCYFAHFLNLDKWMSVIFFVSLAYPLSDGWAVIVAVWLKK